jgi:hypothetical protein
MYAENMANLFLMEIMQGNFDDFNTVSKQAFENMNTPYPAPALSEKQVVAIRIFLRQLMKSWKELPDNKTMTLNFDF